MTLGALDVQQSDDALPLVYLELIDWENEGPIEIETFPNDHAISLYLNVFKPKTTPASESSNTSSTRGGAKSLSHKSEKKKKRSNAENQLIALTLDQEKVKRKDVSDGENLFDAPEDGRFDTLIGYFQERSSILIEQIEAVNIGTPDHTKILHLATSLSEQEKHNYMAFFNERQVNFAWSCIDMPGSDPDLIMHHLNVSSRVKPIKKKIRKIHPHITLLVKEKLKKFLDVGFIS